MKFLDVFGVGFVFIGELFVEYECLVVVYGKYCEINIMMVEYVYGCFQVGMFVCFVQCGDVEDMVDQQLCVYICGYGYVLVIDKDLIVD